MEIKLKVTIIHGEVWLLKESSPFALAMLAPSSHNFVFFIQMFFSSSFSAAAAVAAEK